VRIGISITKKTPFRNSSQEWSNVYYYDGLSGTPSQSQAAGLIDELVTKEKSIHSAAVTFVRGRCWSQIGDKTQNEMLDQHDLSGTGSTAQDNAVDRERAFLFRLRAGNDSRGNPVYFRKWYHSLGAFGAVASPTGSIVSQTTGFTQGQRDALVAALPAIGSIGSGATLGTLCSKNGRLSTAGANWSAHEFYEHHQLGDMWRKQ
jgi:hypothetical protein